MGFPPLPPPGAYAAVAHDQRCGLAQRQNVDVGLGKAAGPEAFRQILGHQRHFTLADRAFDADDMGEYLASLRTHRIRRRGATGVAAAAVAAAAVTAAEPVTEPKMMRLVPSVNEARKPLEFRTFITFNTPHSIFQQ